MNWFKRRSWPGVLSIVWTLALAAEVWAVQQVRRQAARGLENLAQKKQECAWLAGQSPGLSRANEDAIAQDLVQAGQVLREWRETFRSSKEEANANSATAPATPIDGYFDLAAYVERNRGLAAQAGVMIRSDEHFGFAAHANQGPAQALVTAVFRQRLLADCLVTALLEARPERLLGIWRERPRTAAIAEAGVVGDGVPEADFFVPAARAAVNGTEGMAGEAFRLEFAAQTGALRAFLNTLATLRLPVVVHSVEAEPRSNADATADASPGSGALVGRSQTRFTVVVEYPGPLPSS
jgi:hypothetical protein